VASREDHAAEISKRSEALERPERQPRAERH
jgi:hypothetical protein